MSCCPVYDNQVMFGHIASYTSESMKRLISGSINSHILRSSLLLDFALWSLILVGRFLLLGLEILRQT